MMLILGLGSYPTSCLLPVSSDPVCLISVRNFMTSVKASALFNHSLLQMAERFEMSLKCSVRSSEHGIRVSGFSRAFGLCTL
jgi:hypothetical protein